MITITGLNKNFADIQVLHNINLTIHRGEVHALLGKSGVGKSTLLRCINGLEDFNQGELLVNGESLPHNDQKKLRLFRKRIGMIFQDFGLLERKTVYDNVLLPMQCWGYTKEAMHHKVKELLSIVGLADKYHHYPAELSGGQKQRVAIARALTLEPSILLCDEITSALDPTTTQMILSLLKKLNTQLGITIVLVTHQLSVVKQICDTVTILEEGRISLSDSVKKVFIKEPPALLRLSSRQTIAIPNAKTGIKILLEGDLLSSNFFSTLIQQLNIDFNLLSAHTDHINGELIGTYFLLLDDVAVPTITDYLTTHAISYHTVTA